jgi:multiple sugar transport system substrate-binding protein
MDQKVKSVKIKAAQVTIGSAVGIALLLSACSSSSGGSGGSSASAKAGTSASGSASSAPTGASLQLMIGSSGNAETAAVKAATAAWGTKTGNKVTVVPASNLDQQLTQSLAGGSPPDVFYGDTAQFQTLAKDGSLAAYGSQVANVSDFYPALTKTFTYNNKLYCAPKDFSTLGIEINTTMWKAAGLTSADLPTTWDKLESDAKKLTKGKVTGLVMSDTLDRVGAFMAEAGGTYMNADQSKFTFNTPQNITGLTYVQKLAKEKVLKFPKQVGAGWGGEALGKGLAAMTVEGNWVEGAMKTDYPSVKYQIVAMPTGPSGKPATLSFTNCWGVAAKGKHQAAAVSLVNYLTQAHQQLTFAKTVGVMPSRQSVKAAYVAANPLSKPFIDQAATAMTQVTTKGFAQVQQAFDSSVAGLSNGSSDPKTMLSTLQTNASALLGG